MTFTARFAGLAMLALAAVPLAAAPAAALAAPATIVVRDLDLNSAKGLATFESRAEAATRTVCKQAYTGGYRVQNDRACKAAVKAEIADKLSGAQRAQAEQSTDYAAR
jgi:UrcA family protein